MQAQKLQHSLIRPLEGYRALAIIAVLIFHLDKTLLPAGFLGVDLFFVISGFIITKGIVAAREDGTFKLSEFYIKRIRRLFPALLVTVLITLIASYFVMTPHHYGMSGESALYSLVSLANIKFWMSSGYFTRASINNALLHMWSLSVEEQFYLFWPFILVLVSPKNWKIWAIALLILSFSATIFYVEHSAKTAFYWFPFRIYEFMGGAILSILGFRFKTPVLSTAGLLAGSLIFICACLIFDKTSHIALIGGVTVLACMLLLASMESRAAELIYGNPVFVWIGQHSYSIYLVHWPLIVLYVYKFGSLSSYGKIGLGVLSLVFGMIMRWAIEEPFRLSKRARSLPSRKANLTIFATTLATIIAALFIWVSQGIPSRLDPDIRQLVKRDNKFESLVRKGTCFLSPDHRIEDLKPHCYIPDPKKKNMLIIGNSHAADLYPGLKTTFPDWKISQVTAAACAPIFAPSEKKHCGPTRKFIFDTVIPTYRYDLVILATSGSGGHRKLRQVKAFLEDHDQDYIFIGRRPTYSTAPRRFITNYGHLEGLDEAVRALHIIPKEERIKSLERHYYSLKEAFECEIGEGCVWQDNGELLFRDRTHLSPSGSIYVAERFADWLNNRGK